MPFTGAGSRPDTIDCASSLTRLSASQHQCMAAARTASRCSCNEAVTSGGIPSNGPVGLLVLLASCSGAERVSPISKCWTQSTWQNRAKSSGRTRTEKAADNRRIATQEAVTPSSFESRMCVIWTSSPSRRRRRDGVLVLSSTHIYHSSTTCKTFANWRLDQVLAVTQAATRRHTSTSLQIAKWRSLCPSSCPSPACRPQSCE